MKESHGQQGEMLAHALAKRAGNGASGDLAMALFFRWLCGGIPPRSGRAKPNCPRGID